MIRFSLRGDATGTGDEVELRSRGRAAAMPATPDLAKGVNLVSEELERILHSHAFAGSERSCSLLRYLVEHALSGDEPALKERIIGMELFGRDASYDTGNDAIVRVSA